MLCEPTLPLSNRTLFHTVTYDPIIADMALVWYALNESNVPLTAL